MYEISVEGALDQNQLRRLSGLSLQQHVSESRTITTLSGSMIDQAELNGILNTLYNYQYTVLSVQKLS